MGNNGPAEDVEEKEHFQRIVNAFRYYRFNRPFRFECVWFFSRLTWFFFFILDLFRCNAQPLQMLTSRLSQATINSYSLATVLTWKTSELVQSTTMKSSNSSPRMLLLCLKMSNMMLVKYVFRNTNNCLSLLHISDYIHRSSLRFIPL